MLSLFLLILKGSVEEVCFRVKKILKENLVSKKKRINENSNGILNQLLEHFHCLLLFIYLFF